MEKKKKKRRRRRSVILDGPRRKNPVRVCQLEDKGGAVVDGGGNVDVSDEVVSSPPLLRSDSGVDVVEPVGELVERMDPNSGRCWSCLVSVARMKRAGFLYSTHTHPLLDIAVCSVCEERTLAVESDVFVLEPQGGNDGDGRDDDGEDGTTTNSCSWCGLVNDELGRHDASDSIPSSDLLLCDACPRAFCVRCVILSHGGDVAAWEEVCRHTTSGSASGSDDEEWRCPHCCPTSFLEKLRDAHAHRDDSANILGRIPRDIKSRFLEGGFAKWGGYWLPILELGPFDVEAGPVRTRWFDEFRKSQENGRDMTRLIFWYGSKIEDPRPYSFVPKSKIIHYEDGKRMGYGKLPKKVQQKIDKDSKLTYTEELISRGLIEIELDMKKDKSERVAAWKFTKDMLPAPQVPKLQVPQLQVRKTAEAVCYCEENDSDPDEDGDEEDEDESDYEDDEDVSRVGDMLPVMSKFDPPPPLFLPQINDPNDDNDGDDDVGGGDDRKRLARVSVKAMSRPYKSAFIRFFESKRIETEAENPNNNFTDNLKIIQNNFSALSKEEQSVWAEKADEIKSDQSKVACIISESDGELEVEAVDKPFTFIEVVQQDDDVTDEEKNECLDFLRRNSCIVAIDSPPLSNDLAVSFYKDKPESFGYQSGFDRATMQHKVILKNINADNDDANSSDPVSKFLGGMLDSIEERLGAKVMDSFLNINHGQVEETEQVYDDDDDDDENNPNAAAKLIQSKAAGNKSWHSDKIKSKYSGRAFVHFLQHGKQGAIHLRPKNIGLEFKINISSGCVVFMSRNILGFQSGNPHFPRFEHKHFKQGASISWVLELEGIETTESDKCSAIEAAARKQDAEHLDLDGIWGGEKWEPAHFKGSSNKHANFKPRVYSIIADEKFRPLLLCNRIWKQNEGFVRDGHSLFQILGINNSLNERALKANMHTGGCVVAKLRIFPLEFCDEWGYTSGQLKALFEADIEAKDLLVDLLAEKTKQSDSQQVSVSLFDNNGNLVKGPSLYDSVRQAVRNKDKNKVTLTNKVPNIGNYAERLNVSIEMIHAGTIATEGEGLWIPKFIQRSAKPNGGVRVCFTGVIKSHSDMIREAGGGYKKG
ncbi:hypothetical protein ACHAW5_001033 [Stephanodiscus triporus]|uniref:PHD-type domain-containing protein n=1 Tax=Stephanodiscus triporus TaxID=2934178 RepID=A0ABD3PEJ3_9STRA